MQPQLISIRISGLPDRENPMTDEKIRNVATVRPMPVTLSRNFLRLLFSTSQTIKPTKNQKTSKVIMEHTISKKEKIRYGSANATSGSVLTG